MLEPSDTHIQKKSQSTLCYIQKVTKKCIINLNITVQSNSPIDLNKTDTMEGKKTEKFCPIPVTNLQFLLQIRKELQGTSLICSSLVNIRISFKEMRIYHPRNTWAAPKQVHINSSKTHMKNKTLSISWEHSRGSDREDSLISKHDSKCNCWSYGHSLYGDLEKIEFQAMGIRMTKFLQFIINSNHYFEESVNKIHEKCKW